jgi:peptide/nickel transport system ATP-binding protein
VTQNGAPQSVAPSDSAAWPADGVLLRIQDLHTHFLLDEGTVRAVNGVSLTVKRGQTLGVVGESGCGKSVTAFSVLQLIDPPGKIVSGRVDLYGPSGAVCLTDLASDGPQMRQIRGARIAMIFQEPMTSLSPVHTIGSQIAEAARLHLHLSAGPARQHAIAMMSQVGIPDAVRRFRQYPHEMSGGLRQRVMIAMALCCRPDLLIADEPTTALDVTIQAQILQLMRELQQRLHMSIMLITHNLGVVAEVADEVAVMYLGRVVEQAPTTALFENPQHPYTRALLRSIPGRQVARKSNLEVIRGSVPDPFSQLRGCTFCPRCGEARVGRCDAGAPPALEEVIAGRAVGAQAVAGHTVACFARQKETGRG